MPAVPQGYRQGAPTCGTRVKMGAFMGGAVGAASGVLFGTYSGFTHGLRGRELLQTVSKATIQGALTFGIFMAIGSAIRC